MNLPGDWSAKATANDFGVMLVNGVPVSGSYGGNIVGGWVDVSRLLYAGQDNIVSVSVWNASGNYMWDFALRKGETIIWGTDNSGQGQTGEVFFTSVIIDGSGNIVR
jgi:hypothetical protein